jgi:hypothetical protein
MSMSSRFRVCGLSIESDAPIPGLRSSDFIEAPDLSVRMRAASDPPRAGDTDALWYFSPYLDDRRVPLLTIHVVEAGFLLSYAEGATFLVNASRSTIDAWWNPPLTIADAADYLLGSVLAFVLRLRGRVPLHASAIVIDDRAIVFAGAPGAGKSSTAAAFATLGFPVLSDDVVVIADDGGVMIAHPSHAHLSVWPDSARGLFATESLPLHSDVYAKHRVDLIECGYHFRESAVAIDTICILGRRSANGQMPMFRQLRPHEALLALVGQTYSNYLLDRTMREREFDLLGRTVNAVRVAELSFGDRLDDLVSSCRAVALQFANWGPTPISQSPHERRSAETDEASLQQPASRHVR